MALYSAPPAVVTAWNDMRAELEAMKSQVACLRAAAAKRETVIECLELKIEARDNVIAALRDGLDSYRLERLAMGAAAKADLYAVAERESTRHTPHTANGRG